MTSDEAAIKASLCNKSAFGLVFFVACQNAVDQHELGFAEQFRNPDQQFGNGHAEVPTADRASVQDAMSFWASQQGARPKAEVEKLQTALGFNFKPEGLLAHLAYGPPVIDCVMFDWLHIYSVNGILNILTGF